MPYVSVPCMNNTDWTPEEWTGSMGGIERFELDVENPNKFGDTQIWWGGEFGWITYKINVKVEVRKNDLEHTKVHIEYLKKHNKYLLDKYPKEAENIIWGTHVLTLMQGKNCGPSEWTAEDEEPCKGPGWQLEEIDGGQTSRRRSTIWAIQRDRQSVFRQHLLAMDKCCALTGENCQAALEAAHIVPAHLGGRENLSNGILLRADIHRLYDANPPIFGICPDTGKALISGTYRSFDFKNKEIPKEVRYRISDALKRREKYLRRTEGSQ